MRFPAKKNAVAQKHRTISRQEKMAFSTPGRVALGLPSPSHRVCTGVRWRALPAGSAKNGYCDATLFLAKMAVLVVIENRSIKEGLMLLFLLFPFCLEGKFTGFLDNKSSQITRLSLKQLKSILQTERLLIFTYKLTSYVPVESKLQHPPPGQPPGHLNF